MEQLKSKFIGSILGSVVGDAWGSNYEGWDYQTIQSSIRDFSYCSGRYTDDSEMVKGVLESLILNQGKFDGNHMAQTFVKNFDYSRGYGMGAISVLMKIKNGFPWDAPARDVFDGQGSFGNGAAMRICPAALLYHTNLLQLRKIVTKISSITHTHPLGIEGAILQATAIALAVRSNPKDFDQEIFLDNLEMLKLSSIYQHKLKKVREFLGNPPSNITIIKDLGVNITAPESVPCAIRNFLDSPYDFQKVLFTSISLGGDTDTIACMAGAISGALLGVEVISRSWVDRLEGGDYFKEKSEELYDLFVKINL